MRSLGSAAKTSALWATLALFFALSGVYAACWKSPNSPLRRPLAADFDEEWINANLLRVHVNGHWEEIALIPLADHLCKSRHPFFSPYCPPR